MNTRQTATKKTYFRRWRIFIAFALLGDWFAPPCVRGEVVDKIGVRVTASSGGSIFLDEGRAAGIEPGDQVLLYPPGRGIVKATIQAVSSNSSRCTVLLGTLAIDIGIRGEVLIHRKPPQSTGPPEFGEAEEQRGSDVPAHPPWANPLEEWDENTPLLAPAFARDASQREPQLHGRTFAQFLQTWNGKDSDNQYSLGRLGSELWIENPFRQGGGLHIDGEFAARAFHTRRAGSDVVLEGRPDRFSYHWGGTQQRPLRFEVGRFLQNEFPEFGILDGAEVVRRTESGNRFGFSVGFLPEPFPDLQSGDDFQTAIFYRFVSNETEDLALGVGYQKTWHKGTPDRDLVVGSLDYTPNPKFSLHGTIWGDFYDSRDEIKSKTFEITEANLQGTFRVDPSQGIGVHVSQVRWPELLRNEFTPAFDDLIRGNRVLRYGVFTWKELGEHVRLDGRIDRWHDQDQDGTTWEAGVSLPNLLYERGEVALSVYDTDGLYSTGPGGRVSLNRYFSNGFVSVAYDVTGVEFVSGFEDFLQHGFHAGVDWNLSSDVSCSLSGDYWFGKYQNSLGIGLFLQKRF